MIINNDIIIADGSGNDITVYGTLECVGNAMLTGSGSFVLSASANIYSGSPDGITASGPSGSIQTSSRTFSDAANYFYNGLSSQVTGDGLPASVNNLTINNSSGVSLTSSVNINGVLTLTSGEFSIGPNTLTLQTADVPLVRTSGTLTTSSASSLSFGSSGYTGGAAFIIPSGLFTIPAELNDFSVYRTNGLTLNDQILSVNGIVLCNGPLNTNGNLILMSTLSGTALIDGSGTGEVSGNVTMQRYLPSGFGYKYITSPFQTATVSEFSDDMDLGSTFSMFYRYDESRIYSGWVSYNSPANILNPLYGYAANLGATAGSITVDVTGTVNNGNLSLTLYNNNNTYTKGFNLVGNPYPSPIDWDAASGWTKTNIDDALYYFKASTTDQYGGTYSTYINGISSDGLATNVIPSMQGFFIHVSDGAYPVTGTLSLDNTVRITDLTHSFVKSGKTESRPLLRLTASFSDDTASSDPVVIYYDEKADTAFDSNMDALKLMNTDFNVPNLYAIGADGTKLSIDALPLSALTGRTIPLGIKTNRTGNIIFRISSIESMSSDGEIYLSDVMTGADQDMLSGKEYNVTLETGEYSDRFFLHVHSSQTETENVNDITNDNLFRIYNAHGLLMIDLSFSKMSAGTLVVSNLSGQIVFIRTISNPGNYSFDPEIKPGIYIISFISGNTRISKKVFICD
jgi:hypothetical protein